MTEAPQHLGPSLSDAVNRVRRIRKDMGLTQIQLAERLGVSSITVHRWESGESRPRRLALARLREVEDDLAGGGGRPGCARGSRSSSGALDFGSHASARLRRKPGSRLRCSGSSASRPRTPVQSRIRTSETARIDPLPHQFIDPRAEAPYLFHLALVTVERESGESADLVNRNTVVQQAHESDASKLRAVSDGTVVAGATASEPRRREVVERRLLGLRQDGTGGTTVECPVEQVLLLRGAPDVAPGAVPLASRAIGMRAEAVRYAEQHVLERRVGEHRDALRAELPERRRRVGIGFDLRAAELAGRRARLARTRSGRKDERNGLEEIKQEQRALVLEKDRALARIETAPDRIVADDVRFLAHVLVVPTNDAADQERYDASVEEIAVRIALGWEKERSAAVQDVSKPERARLAGLPDWPGFDLLATDPDGEVRSIEVKGRAGRGGYPDGGERVEAGVSPRRTLLALCRIRLRNACSAPRSGARSVR